MEDIKVRVPRVSEARRAGLAFIVLSVVFLSGLYAGLHQVTTRAQTPAATTLTVTGVSNPTPSGVDMAKFWRVWNLLDQNFLQVHASTTVPTQDDKIDAAIAGMVNAYGDPYTVYLPPSDAQAFDESVNGAFEGVGMEIGVQNDVLTVVSPLKGSPAEAAGIRAGDKIIAIDGKAAAHLEVDEAVKLIRGPKDTTVKITVTHLGSSETIVVPIVRDTIKIPTIKTSYNAGSGIFEIDLYNFSAHSADDFRGALRDFFQSGATKLILDLRGNPGGYLDAAVEMASYFLPTGQTVVTEDFRGNQPDITHRSYGYNVFANKKLSMAILIDEGSASASEILAGALSQHNVAVLVGHRSFGKGSVQELFDVGGGAQVKVTVARWLTPNGTSISDGGLTPLIFATTTPQDVGAGRDPQKDAAIQYLTTH